MRLPATFRWIGLAILGMLIAAAVSIAASRVASQQIGLASEPISAGDALAPRSGEKERRPAPKPAEPRRQRSIAPPSPQLRPAPPVTEPTPAPANGGDDSGESSGGGADD